MGAIGVRAAASEYEAMLDEAVDYFAFAKQFGWTSEQTDNEPAWLKTRYQVIFSALAEVRERGR